MPVEWKVKAKGTPVGKVKVKGTGLPTLRKAIRLVDKVRNGAHTQRDGGAQ
jgi:hypothetical protein